MKVHLAALVRAGDLAFLSGQLAFGDDGRVTGDIAEQTRRCLERLEAVLAEHGLNRNHIVRTGIWLTNAENFAGFDAAYAEFFGDHYPARSTVISALALPEALIEIDAVACHSDS